MIKKILILGIIGLMIISCSTRQKMDDSQLRLINEVLLPIYISHLNFQYNVQLLHQDKIDTVIEYNVGSQGQITNKHLFTFKNGKLYEDFSIQNGQKTKKAEFSYDKKFRLYKVHLLGDRNEIYIFKYNSVGLIGLIEDQDGNVLIENDYKFDSLNLVRKIIQFHPKQGETSEYNFIKIDTSNNSYLLDYYIYSVMTYDSMPFSFNKNMTMREVFGEQFDTNGIPKRIIKPDEIRDIKTELDTIGNWTQQTIGDSYSKIYREIKYK